MQDTKSTPTAKRIPWNKGKLTGAKPPLRPKHVWAIRTMLQNSRQARDLALFNLAIDSKLASLPADIFSAISLHLKIVELKFGDVLAKAGSTLSQFTFLIPRYLPCGEDVVLSSVHSEIAPRPRYF